MLSTTVLFIACTVLAGLGVKQLGMALAHGSLFEPLRTEIKNRMDEGYWGFRTLNELFTCKLCMSMQVAVWTIFVPAWVLGLYSEAFGLLPSNEEKGLLVLFVAAAIAFMYAMGVSGIALGVWTMLEYPAIRYETLALKYQEAQQKIEDLEYQVRKSQSKSAALAKESSGLTDHYSPVKTMDRDIRQSKATLFNLDDFRAYMTHVNTSCFGIGCGYRRRDCRIAASKKWLVEWANDRPEYMAIIPDLRKALAAGLPTYFREFSRFDKEIENETAFRDAHAKILKSLS